MTTDIIDRIDELVDDSLAAGEPAGGYEDWNPEPDPDYPRCPHCGRHWHGLPITARIAAMYARRWYDPGYEYASDTSPVLCDGSDIIGPRRPPPTCPSRKHGPLIMQFPRQFLWSPLEVAVRNAWHDFTAPDIPTPPRPGYDFTRWATEDHPTTGPGQQHGWNAANSARRQTATARRRNDKRSRR